MKTISSAVLLATTALMLTPSVSFGQQSSNQAYLMDRYGNPVKVRTGGCVRTRLWTPLISHPQCGPAKAPAATATGTRR